MVKDENLLLADSQKPRFFYGYVIVIVCFIMTVVWWGTFLSFGVFFESLLVEFGWNRAITATASSIHGVLWTVLGIPIARLVEKSGPRLIIGVCGFIGGLGYILMPQITAVWQMYLLYGLAMSIGMAAWVTILPIVARWFVLEGEKRQIVVTKTSSFGEPTGGGDHADLVSSQSRLLGALSQEIAATIKEMSAQKASQ